MGDSVHIRPDYTTDNIDKPFILEGRRHDMVETSYWTISRLSEDNARLLVSEGLRWRYGEPDWEEHYRRIELIKARKDEADAKKRIAELEPANV